MTSPTDTAPEDLMSKPTTCTVCHNNLSTRNRVTDVLDTVTGDYDDLCINCYEADPEDTDELINTPAPTGRKNFNHANCDHPRTPKGRAACRAARAAGNDPAGDVKAPVVELLPTGTVGKGKSVHLMLVMGEVTATLCNPKRILGDWNGGRRPMTDVTCKSCIKLA